MKYEVKILSISYPEKLIHTFKLSDLDYPDLTDENIEDFVNYFKSEGILDPAESYRVEHPWCAKVIHGTRWLNIKEEIKNKQRLRSKP